MDSLLSVMRFGNVLKQYNLTVNEAYNMCSLVVPGPGSKFKNSTHLYTKSALDLSGKKPYIGQRHFLDANINFALQETNLERNATVSTILFLFLT